MGAVDLNLFLVFEAIAREGSVSRAARQLHLTQPAVSHALARLRQQLGDPLFVRRGRTMVPTPRARGLVEPVREALAGLRACLHEPAAFDPHTTRRTFHLGLRDGIEACLLPALLRALDSAAPGIEVHSATVPRRELAQELASGRLDLAMDVQLAMPPEIIQTRLFEDRLVVLMRADHPFASTRSLSAERYLEARHVLVSSRRRGPALEDLGLAQHGHHRRVALRCQHYQAAMEVVAQTDLLLTLPSVLVRELDSAERFLSRRFPLPLPGMALFLYWHRDQDDDPAHRWVRELLGAREAPRLKGSRDRTR